MNPILRTTLATIVGVIFCMMTNSLIIKYGGILLPEPDGLDPNDINSFIKNADKFTFSHYLKPLFAHALGSLLGAFIAAKFTDTNHRFRAAMIVGGIHFLGGLMVAYLFYPALLQLSIIDLLISYFPMAYISYKLTKD